MAPTKDGGTKARDGTVNLDKIFVGGIKNKRVKRMKWLTLEWIKQHSRIDFTCEDELLELYGEDAEETILNICNRTMEDIVEQYGGVPKPLYVAALQLVELNYTHRSPDRKSVV